MKKFLKYVVPSVLAFALSGIYAIVDGFFVGNSVEMSDFLRSMWYIRW